jgi:hypothetical protein
MNRNLILSLALLSPVLGCSAAPSIPQDPEPQASAVSAGKPPVETLGADCSMSIGNGSHAVTTLICSNRGGVPMYAYPTPASGQVNVLRSTSSWFRCWGHGVPHAGGNDTWYGTVGDDNASFGFVPAVDLATTAEFDANPSAEGLPICVQCDQQTARCALQTSYD